MEAGALPRVLTIISRCAAKLPGRSGPPNRSGQMDARPLCVEHERLHEKSRNGAVTSSLVACHSGRDKTRQKS